MREYLDGHDGRLPWSQILDPSRLPIKEFSAVTPDNRRRTARRALQQFWNVGHDYYELAGEANPHPAAEREALFDYLDGHEVVLDLGCGSCENCLWLPDGCSYVGVDISTAGLTLARESTRPAQLVRADGFQLPLDTGCVDVVLSTWVVEHLHDPAATLLEAARVLRAGGLLMIVCSAWDLPYSLPPSVTSDRRLAISIQRLVGQVRSVMDSRHRFDIVREPLALVEAYAPDTDAVHITHSFFLCRFRRAAGLKSGVRHVGEQPGLDPGGAGSAEGGGRHDRSPRHLLTCVSGDRRSGRGCRRAC